MHPTTAFYGLMAGLAITIIVTRNQQHRELHAAAVQIFKSLAIAFGTTLMERMFAE